MALQAPSASELAQDTAADSLLHSWLLSIHPTLFSGWNAFCIQLQKLSVLVQKTDCIAERGQARSGGVSAFHIWQAGPKSRKLSCAKSRALLQQSAGADRSSWSCLAQQPRLLRQWDLVDRQAQSLAQIHDVV